MMRTANLIVLVAVSVLAPRTADSQTSEELAAEVRASEIAFAQTMADRDLEAFTSHVADEAVFYGSRDILRGAEAVAEGWSRFFEGDTPPFSWEPEQVDVLDSGTLALSSGAVFDPEGRRIGTFNSVWRQDADGRWRVVFDKGCPPCDCAQHP
jgi:ketosteroid isomerase-like protein